MPALAFLTAVAVGAAPNPSAGPHHSASSREPIKPTVPEIRHLLAAVFNPPALSATRLLHWSDWRRRPQATARRSHYQRRSPDEPAG
ncbi:hypothetical protein GCM10020295_76410 [Streptomyces cinereospinus]|uniref:Uncharacterized protein n=1 Tax=Streptomyces cinereospinus TaxID=285561 RepID=A0ABV5N1Q3_9ACTN